MDTDVSYPLDEDYWENLLQYADANFDSLEEYYFDQDRMEDS